MKKNFQKIIHKTRSDLILLYFCYNDYRTPFVAKLIAFAAIALTLSPIDIIPDFIPVIGYLDDIIIVPFLIYLSFRLVPDEVLAENKSRADSFDFSRYPSFKIIGITIVAVLWITVFCLTVLYLTRNSRKN